jgi:hypothetical protein
MSDVSRGAGWWLASDGKWYPPETHPSRPTERQPSMIDATAAGQGVDPFGASSGLATRVSASGHGWSLAPDAYWSEQELYTGDKRKAAVSSRRGTLDGRGLLAAVAAFVALVACGFSWYHVSALAATNGHPYGLAENFRVVSPAYGSWRIFIPIAALATVIFGLANFFLRPGDRGAVFVFVALRAGTLAVLGLCVAALLLKTPHLATPGLLGAPESGLLWPAYVAAAAAAVGLLGLTASETKNK